jgi:hypothetical protein
MTATPSPTSRNSSAETPYRLLPVALGTALRGAGPIESGIAAAVQTASLTLEQATTLHRQVPENTQPLLNTAAVLAQRRADLTNRNAHADLAEALHIFSNRVGENGRRRDALTATGKAVQRYTELNREHPGIFRHELATAQRQLPDSGP